MEAITPKRSFTRRNQYIIRHYITGKVLTAIPNDKNVMLAPFAQDQYQHFDFDLIKSKEYADNSVVFIKQFGKNLIRSKKSGSKSKIVLSEKEVNHA